MVDCRRILKWTYAYGYYRFAEAAQAQTSAQASANAEALKQQQEFFEFNQVRDSHLVNSLYIEDTVSHGGERDCSIPLSSKMTAVACASPGACVLSLDQAISECAFAGIASAVQVL